MVRYIIKSVHTEVDTKSPAHALVIALTLISESGPKIVYSPYPRSERESLGGCRTFGVNLRESVVAAVTVSANESPGCRY